VALDSRLYIRNRIVGNTVKLMCIIAVSTVKFAPRKSKPASRLLVLKLQIEFMT
jgi:hypothetical protein